MEENLSALQRAIHYRFDQVKLLQTALAHSSFTNEQDQEFESNERLEFLGDAVLELAISEELFNRFPTAQEGQLTRMRARLVREQTLASLAREIGLDSYLLLGKGEESQGGRSRDSLLSDALEAIIGAIFVDGGYAAAKESIVNLYEGRWPETPELPKVKDFKSLLQELTQQRYKARPVYTLISSSGPEHAKIFEVRVDLPTGDSLLASGSSLKNAQQKAAKKAMEHLENVSDV
jgi:ribonuclease-3